MTLVPTPGQTIGPFYWGTIVNAYRADLANPNRDWRGVETYLQGMIPRQKLQSIIAARAVEAAPREGRTEAGRLAFESGLIEPRDMASPSTPVAGTPFFKIDNAS